MNKTPKWVNIFWATVMAVMIIYAFTQPEKKLPDKGIVNFKNK